MKIKLLLVVCLAVGCLAAPSKDDSGKKDDQTPGKPADDDSGKKSDQTQTDTDNSHWYDGIVKFFKSTFPDVGFGSHGKLTNYPNGNQNKVGANQKLSLDLGENAGTVELDYRREKKSDSDWLGVGYRYPLDSNGHYAYVKVENNLEEGNSSFIWDLDGKYDKLSREREEEKKKKEHDRLEKIKLKEQRLRSWENSLREENNQYEKNVADLRSNQHQLEEDIEALNSATTQYKADVENMETCSSQVESKLKECTDKDKDCVSGTIDDLKNCIHIKKPTLS